MGEHSAQNSDAGAPEIDETYSHDDMVEIEAAMEIFTRVELDLAFSSEKLVNLDKLLMHVLAWENDLEAMALDGDNSTVNLIEKALVFDFLSGFLDSEVNELENFMGSLQAVIVHAREKISASGHLTELFMVMEHKLLDSEELLKQSQEQVLQIMKQSAKLQRTLMAFKHNDWKYDRDTGLLENCQYANLDERPKMQTIEQKRHILRMLEKSLGRELDLEKKLSESKQNEEDLQRKLRLTEQVAVCMEEAAEVVWGRFLEAENASEMLMGTSKELVGQLQIVQFNLNSSLRREDEAKWKLQECMEQLKGREAALNKLESSISKLIADNSEVCALREKVKLLEEQLQESENHLKEANASNEAKEEQLGDMENIISSLKENNYMVEGRAESAEAKITQLTETNMELQEEMSFVKSSNDNNSKKVSLLEKQLRKLEIQLQHAKASSEASQEQQNMLYSAIWDMETLIEELKSKVSKAEIKTENTEEQCIILSETNFELNKEISFLRTKVEDLESSLEQANDAKLASAEDVNVRAKLIMDMVVQLAVERERIQKQLTSLAEANKVLASKLQRSEMRTYTAVHQNGGMNNKGFNSSKHDATDATRDDAPGGAMRQSCSTTFQGGESSENAAVCETEVDSYAVGEGEAEAEAGKLNRRTQRYVCIAILVLFLSLLASYLYNKKSIPFDMDL